MISENSREAYRKVIDSGLLCKRRAEAYKGLFDSGALFDSGVNYTSNELFKKLRGISTINHANISTRLGELVEMGAVYREETRTCEVTGYEVYAYQLTNNMPVSLKKKRTTRAHLEANHALALAGLKELYGERKKILVPILSLQKMIDITKRILVSLKEDVETP